MGGIFNIGDPAHQAFIPQGTFLLAYRGYVDLMGVVLGEPRHYFGLHEWARRGTNVLVRK
jgi:hypothetical protein